MVLGICVILLAAFQKKLSYEKKRWLTTKYYFPQLAEQKK